MNLSYLAIIFGLITTLAFSVEPSQTAEFERAERYVCGYGCKVDYQKAEIIFKRLAEQGDSEAMRRWACLNFSSTDKEKFNKYRSLLQRACDMGNSTALLEMAEIYESHGDYKSGLKYTLMAADKGNIDALKTLSIYYELGDAGEINYPKSLDYLMTFLKLTPKDKDKADACEKISSLYKKEGTPITNIAMSKMYLLRSAGYGNVSAQEAVAFNYISGAEGFEKNPSEAAKWLKGPAEHGNILCMEMLGTMFLKGEGLPKDNVMAYKWLNLASAKSPNARSFRDYLAEKMSNSDISEAQRLSRVEAQQISKKNMFYKSSY